MHHGAMFAWRRLAPVLLVAGVLLGGCGVASGGDDAGTAPASELVVPSDVTRDDVDCSPDALGDDEVTEFVVAHQVVGGQLGARCVGDEDPTLLRAWADLVAISPPGQLTDLALFAGFVNPQAEQLAEDAETTLAFVNAVDDEGSAFQLSVDLDQFDADRNQALLTLAHEFSHVFTTDATQMDRSEQGFADCATYQSADGCFLPDSLIATWVEEFWGDGALDRLDPDAEPSLEAGAENCAADPGFLGEYAASDPEEDFAETFSAFVFAVEVDEPEIQEKLDWLAEQPGLVEFRDRADAAGLAPLPNTFDECG
jgi:hypothetical protein